VHIEKNVFENIFNMVMNVEGNTKDNINARMDITSFFVTVKIWSWFMLVHRSQSQLHLRQECTVTYLPMT
jgi:hypothetical protein